MFLITLKKKLPKTNLLDDQRMNHFREKQETCWRKNQRDNGKLSFQYWLRYQWVWWL